MVVGCVWGGDGEGACRPGLASFKGPEQRPLQSLDLVPGNGPPRDAAQGTGAPGTYCTEAAKYLTPPPPPPGPGHDLCGLWGWGTRMPLSRRAQKTDTHFPRLASAGPKSAPPFTGTAGCRPCEGDRLTLGEPPFWWRTQAGNQRGDAQGTRKIPWHSLSMASTDPACHRRSQLRRQVREAPPTSHPRPKGPFILGPGVIRNCLWKISGKGKPGRPGWCKGPEACGWFEKQAGG